MGGLGLECGIRLQGTFRAVSPLAEPQLWSPSVSVGWHGVHGALTHDATWRTGFCIISRRQKGYFLKTKPGHSVAFSPTLEGRREHLLETAAPS